MFRYKSGGEEIRLSIILDSKGLLLRIMSTHNDINQSIKYCTSRQTNDKPRDKRPEEEGKRDCCCRAARAARGLLGLNQGLLLGGNFLAETDTSK